MAVSKNPFATNPGLCSLTVANIDLWAWGDGSLHGLTALTQLELIDGQIGCVPSALADVRDTLKELALELGGDIAGVVGNMSVLDWQGTEILLRLRKLERLRIRKAGDSACVAWSNTEVGRLIALPAAFLVRHPEGSQPPQIVCV